MSNMIYLAALLLGWREIAETLRLRERSNGIGDGTIDGYKYTIVQRDDQIYIELPDCPREKCEEIVKKILQKLKPTAEIKVSSFGYVSGHCNYCLAPGAMLYRCYRCNGQYCGNHRLPEQHNCPGKPPEKTKQPTTEKKEDKEKKSEQQEQVIVTRVPCG